jgi:hypothetical protein
MFGGNFFPVEDDYAKKEGNASKKKNKMPFMTLLQAYKPSSESSKSFIYPLSNL